MAFEYKPLPKSETKRWPEVAEARKRLAETYRAARHEDRRWAIVLRNAIRAAEKKTIDQLAENMFSRGTLDNWDIRPLE